MVESTENWEKVRVVVCESGRRVWVSYRERI